NGNAKTCTNTVTITSRPTSLVYSGATTGQYSDCATVKAKLTDTATGNPVAGKTVTFTLQTSSGGATLSGTVSALTGSDGVAMTSLTLLDPTNNTYKIVSQFAGMCPFLASSATTTPFTITPEDTQPLTAAGYYTGDVFFWTTGPNSSTATLTLSATVADISDTCRGDIRNAKVTFCVCDSSGNNCAPITGATDLPVGLVNPTNKTVGTATAIVQYNIGNVAVAQLNIRVKVGGAYYLLNNSVYDTICTVAKPVAGGLCVMGAELLNNGVPYLSSGYLATGDGMVADCSSYVQYKSGSNPQGKVNINVHTYRKPDGTLDTQLHIYKITSTAISVFQVDLVKHTCSFSSKCTIQDITNPAAVVSVDGGATFQATMFDGGTT